MTGSVLTSRIVKTAATLPLLLFSAPQCSTAFVLRGSSLSRAAAAPQRSITTAAPAARRTGGRLLLSPSPLMAGERKRRAAMRLMMSAEKVDGDFAEDGVGDEPPIPAGDEEEDLLEDGETELVAEEMEEDEEAGGEEEREEEEVDPMAEVKQHIQDLEKELLVAENRLRDAQDSVQEKGQMGFLRMAAQVDNFRKTSGVGTGDFEADAKAAVLSAVLPAFEPFEAAKEALTLETEREVKFNNSYQALYRQLKDVFTKIGATDFYGVVGEKFAFSRHEKAAEEHNPIMKEGLIIKCLSPGLELKKNVIRKAVCVVSLGPEKKEEEEKVEAETGAATSEEGGGTAAAPAEAAKSEAKAGSGAEGGDGAEAEAPPVGDASARASDGEDAAP